MSQALYRKYRSQRFSELVGQQGVTRVLCNAISRDRLSHAYLFCGPRGTGKTSVARIFAKAINCNNLQNGDCCGECEICLAVAEGRAADVIEIDAASYRKVEETKEILIDRVGYAPLQYKRKVYIIDEVHMLSAHSFNALLKTLEEPPAHVVFCLCTTEPHQLPLTILSRCLRFDFHRLPSGELAAHLMYIATQEGFTLAEDAANELAVLAEGSARDSISLLDQLLVYCETEITLADVRELFQLNDPQLLKNTVDLLAQSDSAPLLAIWQDLARQGADAGQFLLRISTEVKQRYLLAGDDGWRRALGKLWEGLNLLKFESFPALLIELTLLSAQQAYCTAASAVASTSLRQQPATFQPRESKRSAPDRVPAVDTAHAPHVAKPQPMAEQPPVKPSVGETPPVGQELWSEALEQLRANHLTTYALLTEGLILRREGSTLRLVFDQDSRPAYRYIQQDKHIGPLCDVLFCAYGGEFKVVAEIAGEPSSQVPLLSGLKTASPRKPTAEQMPSEVLADVITEPSHVRNSRLQNDEDFASPDELGEALGQTVSTAGDKSRVATKQDVMRLFEAEEVSAEDNLPGENNES